MKKPSITIEASHWWSKNIEALSEDTMVDILVAFHQHMQRQNSAHISALVDKITSVTSVAPDEVPDLISLLNEYLKSPAVF